VDEGKPTLCGEAIAVATFRKVQVWEINRGLSLSVGILEVTLRVRLVILCNFGEESTRYRFHCGSCGELWWQPRTARVVVFYH
jgi:hypothetical protein